MHRTDLDRSGADSSMGGFDDDEGGDVEYTVDTDGGDSELPPLPLPATRSVSEIMAQAMEAIEEVDRVGIPSSPSYVREMGQKVRLSQLSLFSIQYFVLKYSLCAKFQRGIQISVYFQVCAQSYNLTCIP